MKQKTASIYSAKRSAPEISRRGALRGISGAALSLLGATCADGLLAASNTTSMNIITGELKTWRSLKGVEGLEAGLEFLEKTNLAALSIGKHVIDGDALFATVSKSPSRAPETGQFESHRKYIDIQYLISGAERIGVAPATGLTVVSPYSEANDVALYSLPGQYENIEMRPGWFVVFFPEDAHLPLCHWNGQHELHKVVVKLSVDHWQARRKK